MTAPCSFGKGMANESTMYDNGMATESYLLRCMIMSRRRERSSHHMVMTPRKSHAGKVSSKARMLVHPVPRNERAPRSAAKHAGDRNVRAPPLLTSPTVVLKTIPCLFSNMSMMPRRGPFRAGSEMYHAASCTANPARCMSPNKVR